MLCAFHTSREDFSPSHARLCARGLEMQRHIKKYMGILMQLAYVVTDPCINMKLSQRSLPDQSNCTCQYSLAHVTFFIELNTELKLYSYTKHTYTKHNYILSFSSSFPPSFPLSLSFLPFFFLCVFSKLECKLKEARNFSCFPAVSSVLRILSDP